MESKTTDAVRDSRIAASVPQGFGELLRKRREEAKLSIAALARQIGVVRTTITNIEQGMTTPSPHTLRLLASCKALRLTELESSEEEDQRPAGPGIESSDAWHTQQYDPMQMVRGMDAVLNGPGGQLEQTLLYLDPQSAADWYQLSNSEQYMTAFRSKMPLDKLAERIIRESNGVGLDVDGLGCGDGKTETALMQRLADQMPAPPDLHLYLLDISHVLLYSAYRFAFDTLAPRRIPVAAIHGNFNDISKNPMLYMHPRSVRRLRVFLLMGYTFGNINDEPWLFRDLAACAQSGDLAVIDCQLVRAPADRKDEIFASDAPVRAKQFPDAYTSFLSGPLRRHCNGLIGINLRSELSTHCLVPGSYAVESWASVEKKNESIRQFLLWRVKRYELEKLSACLRGLGWNTLQTWKYGPDNLAAVLLIQRQ